MKEIRNECDCEKRCETRWISYFNFHVLYHLYVEFYDAILSQNHYIHACCCHYNIEERKKNRERDDSVSHSLTHSLTLATFFITFWRNYVNNKDQANAMSKSIHRIYIYFPFTLQYMKFCMLTSWGILHTTHTGCILLDTNIS